MGSKLIGERLTTLSGRYIIPEVTERILYYNTNDPCEKIGFSEALLRGIASKYGLYMVDRKDIPRIERETLKRMANMKYEEVAFEVLFPYLRGEIKEDELRSILSSAYREDIISPKIEHLKGNTYILWLSTGPTYSFKDYAARFFGFMLNYILRKKGSKRIVVVATSGDTGGAVADALFGLENIQCIVLYPKDSISEGQRRQMTTLKGNIYAFEVKGGFDVCQALAKKILSDSELAFELGDREIFTSANSISIGRLLPQIVYPFYAFSRIGEKEIVASIPSGNFGNMLGTVIAKKMGLPIKKILCAVNENRAFPEFLEKGEYTVRPTVKCPSSAMDVAHPSNLARLFELYGGHIYDERDKNGSIIRPGIIDRMPDLEAMRKDIFSYSVKTEEHYSTMRKVYEKFGIILDPHGACAFRAYEVFSSSDFDRFALIYETADPGKFPEEVKKALDFEPPLPPSMEAQKNKEERIFRLISEPKVTPFGSMLSETQVLEAKELIRNLFKSN